MKSQLERFTPKALLVGGGKTFQNLFKALLIENGYELVVCNDGQEALNLIEGQYIDVVCSGFHLRDMDGIALCRKVRGLSKYASKPFVLLISKDNGDTMANALAAGVTDVFHRNDIQQLLAFIKRFPSSYTDIDGRVLYVEDSKSQRELLKSILERKGLFVDAFASAEEAWQSFTERNYDIVLTDIVFEGKLSGLAFVNQIRRQLDAKGDVPIITLTAFDDKTRRIGLLNLGITDYLLKPVVEDELFARIGGLLKRIAERRQIENELHISAIDAIAFRSQAGIMVTDPNGALLRVNQAFTNITGYTAEEIIGKNPRILQSGRQDAEFYARMWESINRTGGWEGEIWNKRKNGEVYPEQLSIAAVKNQNGIVTNYVATLTDITERMHLEQERLALEKAHRDALVREVHHRIKNNLQGITGILRQFAQKHPEITEALNEAISQVNSIALIHGLLGQTSKTEVRLCELTSAIAAGVESVWQKPIAVYIPAPLTPYRIAESEAVPLALVLNELISNAVKHGGMDGHVNIDINHEPRLDSIRLTIHNTGSIPAGFGDGDATGFGTGLQLTASLLPREGARLTWTQEGGIVTTILELDKPIIHLEPEPLPSHEQ